jgi:hypothetical protein
VHGTPLFTAECFIVTDAGYSPLRDFLKIYPGLQKWSVQFVLVSEAILSEVVLHVAPPDLRPNVTGKLKFQPARQLVAPVSTVH